LVPYLAAFNAQLMPATPAPTIMIASAIKSPQSRAGVPEEWSTGVLECWSAEDSAISAL
jgi:hypothetical protein